MNKNNPVWERTKHATICTAGIFMCMAFMPWIFFIIIIIFVLLEEAEITVTWYTT